jgi:two-component system, NtrC family, nitrogen regulation sensor histidine kinase NtrY
MANATIDQAQQPDQVDTEAPAPIRAAGLYAQIMQRRDGLVRIAAYVLAVLALISALGTHFAFARAGPAGPQPGAVLALLYLNLTLLLLLGALVAHRLVRIWVERRRGLAGSRLHLRLVFLFSVVAMVPTILVAVFSMLLFDLGLRTWFSERISTAVTASKSVAEGYLDEHRQVIRGDILAMANDLNRDAAVLLSNPARFAKVVTAQAALRNLTEVVVFENGGRVLARTGLTLTFEFDPVSDRAMQRARDGEVVFLTSDTDDRIRALVYLDQFVNAFLYVGRFVDPEILAYIDRTKEAVHQYEMLEGKRFDIQVTFIAVFAVVALLLLMAAIWVGLNLATRLTQPVSALIEAAERVSAGDLEARVGDDVGEDELGQLSRSFNRMTRQLGAQRRDLVEAHRQEDLRRRFTEAVLAGVSSGVIGLDHERRVHLPNRAAAHLLSSDVASLSGRDLAEIVPEMRPLLDLAMSQPHRRTEAQLDMVRGNRRLALFVRVAAEVTDGEVTGFVVTFDDVTELQSAQRKAAWADVARRIAHEIKNPLTPIQLAAERLKRRYLRQITDDPKTFEICTDTIVRQVGDIGRMVDEFSNFARMPLPKLRPEDLVRLVHDQVALQRAARHDIGFEIVGDDDPCPLMCDAQQVRQVLTNLLTNAVEAIDGREPDDAAEPGQVSVRFTRETDLLGIEVVDNGRGLPVEDRHRLTEPYVTTREKGTGLGLAIVKKIMEDHGGEVELTDRSDGRGSRVRLSFPANGELVEAADDTGGEATAGSGHDASAVVDGSTWPGRKAIDGA